MQKEFCRHYVAGYGFQSAALMAGYSAHVAQFRGEQFLSNRFIIARIQRLRANTYLSHTEILEHKVKLTDILANTEDPLIIIRTINSLARLAKLRPANLPDQDEEYPSKDHFDVMHGRAPSQEPPSTAFNPNFTTDEIVAQPADSQVKKYVSNYFKPHLKLWPPTSESQANSSPAPNPAPASPPTQEPQTHSR